MTKEMKIEAVKHVLASIFASQRTLKAIAPEFNWSGLGNLLGDYGEMVAIEAYGFTKAPGGSSGFDAYRSEKGLERVQIKTNFAASQVGFRGDADIMLVLNVTEDGSWTEMYYGPFLPVVNASRHSARDNKSMIAVSKLRELQRQHGYNSRTVPGIPEIEVMPLPTENDNC